MSTPYIDVKVRIYKHSSLKGLRRSFTNWCNKEGGTLLKGRKVYAWASWDNSLLKTKKRIGNIHITKEDNCYLTRLAHEIHHIIEGHFHKPPFKEE